jgi:hypothetical protein
MPRMAYHATNFPATYGAALSGSRTLNFTWPELLWAAISVGRAELLHLLRHGPYSAFEIVYRAAILFANLTETAAVDLERSEAYDGLDPSEKGAVSYFMGLTVAKLFAHWLLDVPWLMHLDVYRRDLQPVVNGGGKPDLVGKNTAGEWIAIESKGRTHGYDAAALERAKEQVECLASVSGQALALRVALLTHFGDGVLQCAADDPEETRRKSRRINLPLSEEKLFEAYYRPFREWLRETPNARTERVQGQEFVVADTPEVDLTIGIPQEIARGELAATTRARPARRDVLREDQGNREYLGADGVFIRTGTLWSEENMRRQPQERSRQ